MRLLVFVLNILVGSCLLAQSSEILADSVDAKGNKYQRGHATRSPGKSKKHRMLPVKQKRLHNSGDVWERIRSGMQIPRPGPVQTLQDQTILKNNGLSESHPASINTYSDSSFSAAFGHQASTGSEKIHKHSNTRFPVAVSASTNKYINYKPYGRIKLNSTLSSGIRNSAAPSEQLFASKNGNMLGRIATEHTRLHTRISFHPELHKVDYSKQLISSASPLAKSVKKTYFGKSVATVYSSEISNQGLSGLKRYRNNQAVKFERVNKHIVWYSQHRDYLHQVAERARPYLYHIVESLSKHKLPYELALLPVVESAYQPTALSPKSAAGLWQFIPSTGQDFDLFQSDHYDARLDITASTEAAVRYLSFLKRHFNGDWLLALAAYNCGLGVVDNAINLNLAEGLDTDFWSLRLPEETQEYVPRFLALTSIFANPGAHGLKLAPVKNEPYFVKVKIDRKHDIDYLAEKDFKEVAQLANLSYEQFSRLNPGYINTKLSADGPFTFLMPVTNATQLHQRLASIAQFLNKSSTITASYTSKKRITLSTADEQKTAFSQLTDITLPQSADLVAVPDPFLSLSLDNNQTTPRIANQPVISPDDLNSDPKRVKKNI